jgi:hypothetical protein
MSEPIIITNDTDLHYRIMKLSNLKEEQELVIKRNVRELVYSLHPSMMIKNLLNKLGGDKETRSNLKTLGLNLGKDFLINKIFGRSGSLKGFITSLFVKKATDYMINKHSDTISNGLHKVEDYIMELKAKVSN